MNTLIEFFQARMKLVVGGCYLLLALIIVLSAAVDRSHAHSWVEQNVPFFWSLFAFAASAAIIGFTRWFGRSGIQARPDFYDTPTDTSEEEA